MKPGMEKDLLKQLEQLGPEEQRQVLDFARNLRPVRRADPWRVVNPVWRGDRRGGSCDYGGGDRRGV